MIQNVYVIDYKFGLALIKTTNLILKTNKKNF